LNDAAVAALNVAFERGTRKERVLQSIKTGAPLEDIADLLGHKSLTMIRDWAPNKLHAVVSLLGASDARGEPAIPSPKHPPRK
jgi:hypothetical protein